MKIIVDAMSGDNAPDAVVKGVVDAVKELSVEAVLVGKGEVILDCLNKMGMDTLPKGIEIANADDVVTMEDDPTSVLKTRKESSMVLGLKMLADGEGDAFISAGNTGALLTASTLLVRRIHGVRRACFGPVIPTKTGSLVLIDCGANVECTPAFLQQFAIMGSVFANKIMNIERPRVALLNNGTESCKGTAVLKEAYAVLEDTDKKGLIRFIGNIEARDAMLGGTDVLVSDGFTGNIFLKAVEGTALFMMSELKHIFTASMFTKLAAAVCRKGIRSIKSKMDYRETGGTAIVGLKKTVIKAHGSSDARAIRSAILQATYYAKADISDSIGSELQKLSSPEVQIESSN